MQPSEDMKTIKEQILKNKEFFLLNFINDVPEEEDLLISEKDTFKVDFLDHPGEC